MTFGNHSRVPHHHHHHVVVLVLDSDSLKRPTAHHTMSSKNITLTPLSIHFRHDDVVTRIMMMMMMMTIIMALFERAENTGNYLELYLCAEMWESHMCLRIYMAGVG